MTNLDYCDLNPLYSEDTFEGFQFEAYKHETDNTYIGLLRQDRFGKILGETKKYTNKRDLDQVIVASQYQDTDIDTLLEGNGVLK